MCGCRHRIDCNVAASRTSGGRTSRLCRATDSRRATASPRNPAKTTTLSAGFKARGMQARPPPPPPPPAPRVVSTARVDVDGAAADAADALLSAVQRRDTDHIVAAGGDAVNCLRRGWSALRMALSPADDTHAALKVEETVPVLQALVSVGAVGCCYRPISRRDLFTMLRSYISRCHTVRAWHAGCEHAVGSL